MRNRIPSLVRIAVCAVLAGLLSLPGSASADDERIEFNRDIRPILSDTCYTCHGPDEGQRQTEFRLDVKDGMLAELESGGRPIVPGDSAASVLYRRISSSDVHERMPPAEADKQLTAAQIELIKQWIDQGADWQDHWAFLTPQRPVPPEVKQPAAVHNPIDQFLLARLERAGLKPAPEADKTTLIRRVTFDLTGLPPTLEEIDSFLADTAPGAYERLVDRLLDSPRYGEHLARDWLDVARYGDTHGLHLDNERSLWPYRDWVIEAFNRNMPFDQFTVEQLAGDLLPEPTIDQLIATGFNRCNVTTSEGGSIAQEYRVRYAVDRVETASTVWLGLTMGCAVCHDHKYDPVSQTEFYRLYAYFYNIDENPMDGNALIHPPFVKAPTPEQSAELARLQEQIAPLEERIQAEVAKVEYVDPQADGEPGARQHEDYVWIEDGLPRGAQPTASGGGPASWQWVSEPEHPVFSGTKSTIRTAQGNSQHFFTGADPGLRIGAGDRLFAYVYLDPENPPREIMLQFNDGSWDHRAIWGEDLIEWGTAGSPSRLPLGPLPETGQWVRLEVEAAQVGLKPGSVLNGWAFTQFDGTVYWDRAGIVTQTPQDGSQFESLRAWEQVERAAEKSTLPKPLADILKIEREKRTEAQAKQLQDYFIEHVYAGTRSVLAPLHEQLADLKKRAENIDKAIPRSMIMKDRDKPLETFVLIRGEYDREDKDRKVEPGVPAVLPPLPEDAPPNRLALARWLVDPEHPLTARVTVNRFWQKYFGTGLVKTTEDFGLQGEWPSHPELLDWLATEFVRTGWDVKRMQKLIVMSAAYRQVSHVTPEKYAKDPENRLLARGPRFRFDAEVIRDTALAVSGLLVEQVGGSSVKPYQPPGLWEAVGYTNSNTANFKRDSGRALYRRSMYTFWKRTSPPPSMSTFDAPSRESCTVRRARTNTPLQALVLMNDTQFVEAARHLAERIMTEGGSTTEERIEFAFRLATARRPDAEEMQVFLNVYETYLAEYRGDPEAAVKLLSVGESPRNDSLDAGELAAWTMIANLVLNLNETITKG